MKNKTIIFCLILCLLISLVIIFLQYRKIVFYKNDLNDLLGENKYTVEILDDNHTMFYAANDNYQGFDILLDYMGSLGYKHIPASQLGALHFFEKSNGTKASCDVINSRTIIICDIEFGERQGDGSVS